MKFELRLFFLLISVNISLCKPTGPQVNGKIESSFAEEDGEFVKLGRDLCGRGQYDEAIHFLTKAIEADPFEARYYARRGNCHATAGHFDKATADFKRAILYDQYNPDYRMLLCEAFYESGKFNEAKGEKILQPPDFAKFGNALCSLGKFEDAIRSYSWAIERFAAEEFYRSRGNCYVKMENLDAALSDYEKVVENDWRVPESRRVGHNRVLLSLALFDCGKSQEALRVIHALDDFQLMMLGDEFLARKQSELALSCYTGATKKNPENAECFAKRGLYHWQMKNLDRAILDFAKSVIIRPSYVDGWISLAEVVHEVGRSSQAMRMLENIRDKFADTMTYANRIRLEKALTNIKACGNVVNNKPKLGQQSLMQNGYGITVT